MSRLRLNQINCLDNSIGLAIMLNIMSTITSVQLRQKFDDLKSRGELSVHMKSGRFLSRWTIKGELVLTVVAGKLETIHVAKMNDVILQNIMIGSSAERYVIDFEVFDKRYERTGKTFDLEGKEWEEVEAAGIAEGVEVSSIYFWTESMKSDMLFTIPAPWAGGEDMLVTHGDWILRPVLADLSVPNPNDIYRVDRKTFKQTYAPFIGEAAQKLLERLQASRVPIPF